MPSGPKKRKAAKKKKENQHNNHTGNDDLNQKVEVLGSSSVEGIVGHQSFSTEWEREGTDISSPGEIERSVFRIDREFEMGDKPEEDVEQERRFEDDDSVSKCSSDDSSGGSGSNSDDETRDISPEAESVKVIDYLSERRDENEVSKFNKKSGNAEEENSPPLDLVEISQSYDEANSCLSSSAPEPVFKEDEEIKPSSVEDKVDTPSEETVENIAIISDTIECRVGENKDDPSKEVEHQGNSRVTEPSLAPTPIPVQTSWKSCCGLFELFTGSGR